VIESLEAVSRVTQTAASICRGIKPTAVT